MKLSTAILVVAGLAAGHDIANAQQAVWEQNLRAGAQLVEGGQYSRAEQMYIAAVREAEKFGPQDQRLALTLAALASFYLDRGQTEKALPLAKQAIAIHERRGPRQSQEFDNQDSPQRFESPGMSAVFINGVALTPQTLQGLMRYGIQVPPGRYWYDHLSGAWGYEGGPAAGQVTANMNVGGRLRPDASGGGTGVYVNGRELHPLDVANIQRCTPVYRGRYWVNAQGIGGLEGRAPSFNLAALCQQASSSYSGSRNFGSRTWHNGDGSWSYKSDATGLGAVSDGQSIYITGK